MNIFVNLRNFREIVGDNKDLRKKLFSDFIRMSQTNLEAMHDTLTSGDAAEWRRNAHMMKGACQNLGANMLADLMEEAESCSDSQKEYYYQKIVTLFNLVKDFLAQESDA